MDSEVSAETSRIRGGRDGTRSKTRTRKKNKANRGRGVRLKAGGGGGGLGGTRLWCGSRKCEGRAKRLRRNQPRRRKVVVNLNISRLCQSKRYVSLLVGFFK